jgi:hypothetical protein
VICTVHVVLLDSEINQGMVDWHVARMRGDKKCM